MKYCNQCGHHVSQQVPEGDNRERYVCDDCGVIHYSNPKNVCGAILTWGGKILLCKRAIEPRYGQWTLPAGFMENHESVTEAAARESLEEANARSEQLELFGVFSLPHISQVYLMFHGELETDAVSPGIESLQTGLFALDEIPWDDLAFPVVTRCLELFIEARQQAAVCAGVFNETALRHEGGRIEWIG